MTEDLFVIETNLNYWFNLLYGNYLDFINHLTDFDYFSKESMNNEGRYWVNWLSSYNILKNICVGWKGKLVDNKVFSEEEYSKKLNEFEVLKYKNILITKIRNSLFHAPQGEWGFINKVEHSFTVHTDFNEENLSLKLWMTEEDNHYPVLIKSNEKIKDIIDHTMISQRLLIDWIIGRIYEHYNLDADQ